jgi:hypothetical protein
MRKTLRRLALGRDTLLRLDLSQRHGIAAAATDSCGADCPTNERNCPTTFYIGCPSLAGNCQSVAC